MMILPQEFLALAMLGVLSIPTPWYILYGPAGLFKIQGIPFSFAYS